MNLFFDFLIIKSRYIVSVLLIFITSMSLYAQQINIVDNNINQNLITQQHGFCDLINFTFFVYWESTNTTEVEVIRASDNAVLATGVSPVMVTVTSSSDTQTGDYLVADYDGDGVTNGNEIDDDTNPENPCDFFMVSVSVEQSGDYLIADCDGDGVINGTELIDSTDPAQPCDFNVSSITVEQSGDFLISDCDNDGISNDQEINDNTDPFDACSAIGGTLPSGIICDIEIINEIITPNGDGVNDGFHIRYIESYPENSVEIFNRWGVKVFGTKGYENSSNAFVGISNGRQIIQESNGLPASVYFYSINYNDNGQIKLKSGYLYVNQ